MGNRFTFYEISQHLWSIYRVPLWSFKKMSKNNPYLVRYGQLESVIGYLRKETYDDFIHYISLHQIQDVIQHHCQGGISNLTGRIYRLASTKVQQGLVVLECNFPYPTSSINMILFKDGNRKVGKTQPFPVFLRHAYKKTNLLVY